MRFLITGATGFVGSNLIHALVQMYGVHSVVAMAHSELDARENVRLEGLRKLGVQLLRCDLLELPHSTLASPEFDVVYHLAAYVETEAASRRIRVNTEGTNNLINWLGPRFKGKRFIFTSTLASVDRSGKPTGPMTESTPCCPRTEYGRTKLEAETIVCQLAKRTGFDFTVLRLCTIIGPGFRPGGMFAVFPDMLRKKAVGTRLNWPGKTSLLDIANLVEILLRLPNLRETANETYVLSNGEDPSFDKLLDEVALTVGVSRKRIMLPSWLWSVVGFIASSGAEAALLPHSLRTFCWRVSLMVYDGIYADATKLNSVLPIHYRAVFDSLQSAYNTQPIMSDHDARQ
jgi:nucleoside-diphosphate-sugar epimerase